MTDAPDRYCPLCDRATADAVCATHAVPTVALRRITGDDALPEGTTLLDRYVVDAPLGGGGMGAVYRGRQLPFGRPVAIKTLLPRLVGSASHLRRFYQEADALHRLTHPNVVRVFDFGLDDATGVAFLVMELVDGAPLGARIGPRGLPEREACGLMAQVASALADAHAANVVHRDLKPSNVLVWRLPDGDDVVKVVDFGLAKLVDDAGPGHSTAGYVVGTPAYISPEQVAQGPVDERADLYALGCILYHALTGAPPFTGAALELLSRHLATPAPPLPETLSDGATPSAALRDLVAALLAKRPEDRPRGMSVVARSLKALAAGRIPPALDRQPPAPVAAPERGADGDTLRRRFPPTPEAFAPTLSATPTPLPAPPSDPTLAPGATPGASSSARRRIGALLAAAAMIGIVGVGLATRASGPGPAPILPVAAGALAGLRPPPPPRARPPVVEAAATPDAVDDAATAEAEEPAPRPIVAPAPRPRPRPAARPATAPDPPAPKAKPDAAPLDMEWWQPGKR